jgi:hypothetical protein
MKLGVALVIMGILAFLFNPLIGVVLLIAGVGILFISSAPTDYDDEEQLNTEDEINFIYYDE